MNRESGKVRQRWVVKIGSSLITNEGRGLDTGAIDRWVSQVVELRQQGFEIVVVSSGAVAEGMSRLGLTERPAELHALQAAAAVGQMGVVQSWESRFKAHGIHTAQVLLSHDDLSARRRYLNARSTLQALLAMGVIPVVNENDTVATDEIRLGDNDTLAALTVNLVEADLLVILTDQDGLFDADPRSNPDAKLVAEAAADDPRLETLAGPGVGALGRGGMQTKVRAARLAARSGASTVIAHGLANQVLCEIAAGASPGTRLHASQPRVTARKQWIAGQLAVMGSLMLDDGAVKVLRESGKSLLPVGVTRVAGDFTRGDVVSCLSADGTEVARGLVNYDADEARSIAGQPSAKIVDLLGYAGDTEIIHRDNLVIL